MSLGVGHAAPDAKLDAWERGAAGPRKLSLADHRGRWVVLFFYPRDFTLISPSEFAAFTALQAGFERENAVILAESSDSFHSHRAWFESDPRLDDVAFPVIADTVRRFSEDYGVLLPDGATLRGTFIIDPEGILRHMSVTALDVGRNADEVLRILQALKTGDLCPAGWTPGQPTLEAADEHLSRAFPRLDERLLAEVRDRAVSVRYPAGHVVIEQGGPADQVFVITSGEAEVFRQRDDDPPELLSTLGPGEHFGEIGLLLEGRRTASVRARGDLELLALDRDAFRNLVEESRAARLEIASIAKARMAGDTAP
jgi:peroxiredoxin (alkyl hydroperoxide reductase subunit C)